MIDVVEYLDAHGESPFAVWRSSLDNSVRSRIAFATIRIGNGNFSNTKGVTGGIFETRLEFGPGYRIYFGKDGDMLVILLGGGSKRRQSADIAAASKCWQDYKARKKV